ncbi:MAG: hypothetical protein RRY39_08180 [Odoribacter sp.]
MKYLFDIKKIDIVNLNGVDLKEAFKRQNGVEFEKAIGNLVFENSKDIDLADKAREIHKGNPVELSEREKGLFEEIMKGRYIPFIERQILSEIKEV